MRLFTLLSIVFFCPFSYTFAQYGYYNDISRFAYSFDGGSARIQALGNAQTSLGGDISSISGNPAGLGFFNKSVFSFGYEFNKINSNSEWISGRSTGNDYDKIRLKKSSNQLNNIAIVFQPKKNDYYTCYECPRISFGFSYITKKDFGSSIRYNGFNNNNSIIDYFINEAQDVPLAQLSNTSPIQGIGILQEAYDHYLLNPVSNLNNTYYSFVGGYPLQDETIETSGNISQFSFSTGINIKDKIYLGGGLNIYSFRYMRDRYYSESEFEILVENQWESEGILDYLYLNDFLKISGAGVSTSVGIIFKPINQLNIGISYSSKTFMNLNEEGYSELETNYFNYYFEPEDTTLQKTISATAKNISKYKIITPSKLSIGSSFFYKKFGFITADIDLINYSSGRIQSYDFDPFYDNREITEIYKSLAINYRLGIEGRYNDFYIRLGYNFLNDSHNNAYQQINTIDNSRVKKSIGIGYSNKSFSIDITYVSSGYIEKLRPYSYIGEEPIIQADIDRDSILLSLGLNFNNR